MTIIRISEKYNSAALGVRDEYHLEDRDFSQEEILQPLTRPYKQSLDQELVLRVDVARIQIDGLINSFS